MKKKKLKPYICPKCKQRVTNEQIKDSEGHYVVGGIYKKLKKGQRYHTTCYDRMISWLFRG